MAWSTRSETPSSPASSITASMCSQPEWTPPSEIRPIACRRPRRDSRAEPQAARRARVLEEAAVRDRVVDPRQVLLDDRPRAEVEVADLGVAHLPVGKADVPPRGRERRVRIGAPELVEDRACSPARWRCRARPGRGPSRRGSPAPATAPARSLGPARSGPSGPPPLRRSPRSPPGRGCAPPTRAPSTSGWEISSAALPGLTEPP